MNIIKYRKFYLILVPQATPQLVMVRHVNHSAVNLTWSQVSCCNSSGESPHYQLTLCTYDNSNSRCVFTRNATVPSNVTFHTFADLEPNTYFVSIAAVNSIGAGNTSKYSEFIEIKPPPGKAHSQAIYQRVR